VIDDEEVDAVELEEPPPHAPSSSTRDPIIICSTFFMATPLLFQTINNFYFLFNTIQNI
jgi:hypothetical protein